MTRRPPTTAAVTASSGPSRVCHSLAAATTEVTWRVGTMGVPAALRLSRMKSGKKLVGNGERWAE